MRLQFGDCILDSDTRELARGDKPVHLEPKAYRLLQLLLDARPKALSKMDLQDDLWPETYVSERSLARLVADLRSAIGDRARKRQFIRKIHGFGYAFCAEMSFADRRAAASREADYHYRIIWGERGIALGEGENVLGRDPSVAVWIDFDSVSRRHARILVSGGCATIEDLGSRNGTYVRQERLISPRVLKNGDPIKIGAASLVFRCFSPMGATARRPAHERR